MKSVLFKMTIFLALLFLIKLSFAQIIFFEDFESVSPPSLPAEWSTTTLGTDGGFYTGDSEDAISAGFWIVDDHTTFAMTNDDVCSCDKSDDFLILPEQNFSSYTDETLILQFDTWMEDYWEGIGMVKVNTGSGWTDLYLMEPIPAWQTRIVDLSSLAGQSSVSIAFHYNDEGEAGLGLAIDDVSIYIPEFQYDAAIYTTTNTYSDYLQIPISQLSPVNHSITIYNNGQDELQNIEILAESSQAVYSETVTLSSLNPAEYITLDFVNPITLSELGINQVNYSITHDNIDEVSGNDNSNYTFMITDSTMSKESGTFDAALILLDGESIAQKFNVFEQDTLTSVTVNLMMTDESDLIKFYIYEIDEYYGPTNIIDSTQIAFVPENGWTTYSFKTDTSTGVYLTSGNYAIGMNKIGEGLTAIKTTEDFYTPNSTYTSHFFVVGYGWYNNEQYYSGVDGKHHTYLMRANFGSSDSQVIINETKNDNKLSIYPNPSNGIVNINSKHQIEEIRIYDALGRFLNEFKGYNNQQLDFSSYSKGIYYCKIKLNNTWVSKKIIIK